MTAQAQSRLRKLAKRFRYSFQRRFAEPVKLRIAEFLELRHPDRYCWTELVMWAMFGGRTLGDCRNAHRCKTEIATSPFSCYCGKYMRDPADLIADGEEKTDE